MVSSDDIPTSLPLRPLAVEIFNAEDALGELSPLIPAVMENANWCVSRPKSGSRAHRFRQITGFESGKGLVLIFVRDRMNSSHWKNWPKNDHFETWM